MEKREIVDSFVKTSGTIINWRMMELVIEHVKNLEDYVDHHDAGNYADGKCTLLLHTLNWTNRVKKELVSTTYRCFASITFVLACLSNFDAKCHIFLCNRNFLAV